jgi:hypothetical protein
MDQIFKKKIPKEILFEFLENNSKKNQNNYEFNNYYYKKSKLNNNLIDFLDSIESYYHVSKKKYVTRYPIYKNILTVIRQICKSNHISFCSKIKYINNTYEIIYYIYF